MNILITGAAGYIGNVLVQRLLMKQDIGTVQVVGYDNLMYKQTSLLPWINNPNFKFIHGDVRDHRKLGEAMKDADAIIPLAAIVGAPACDADPVLATAVNYEHIKFIMENKSKDQLVIMPNTNSGYGTGQGTSFCTEESPLKPISHYGRTKCDAEKAVLDGGGVSLRLATVFGLSARMRLDLLVNDFTYRAMNDGFLVLFEKHFKRNYIHVHDVAYALALMVYLRNKVAGQAYNVGLSSANLSKWELANKIKEHLPQTVILCDDFKEDPDKRNYIVSNEKLEKLGWQPQFSLDDGIKELIAGFPMLYKSQQVHTNL